MCAALLAILLELRVVRFRVVTDLKGTECVEPCALADWLCLHEEAITSKQRKKTRNNSHASCFLGHFSNQKSIEAFFLYSFFRK